MGSTILISICVFVFVLSMFGIFGKRDNGTTNKITFNKAENAQYYNEMREILINYDTFTEEQDFKYLQIVVNEQDEYDKDLLSAMYYVLHERTDSHCKGGQCDIFLEKGEELVWKHRSMSLSKVKVISRYISGAGFRQTTNGLRLYAGNVQVYPNEQMVMVESLCTIYLTNKRLIIVNPQGKTYVTKLSDIIDYAIQGNSILISVANGNPIKITTNDNFYFDKDENGRIYSIEDSTFQFADRIRKLKTNQKIETY